jgi:hypothetical protein
MADSQPMLEPLLTHLYGPRLGEAVSQLAAAGEGDRVVILGTNASLPGGRVGPDEPTMTGVNDELHDPFPVIDFVELSTIRTEGRALPEWDILVGTPPQRERGSESDLAAFLTAAASTAGSNGRAILLFGEALLASSVSLQDRATLLSRGHVRSLVFTGVRPIPRHSAVKFGSRVALIEWQPEGLTGSATTVSQLNRLGDPTQGFEVVLQPQLPWTYPLLDPARAEKLAAWAKKADASRLREVADLPVPDLKPAPASCRVAHQGHLTSLGLDLDADVADRPERAEIRGVDLQVGDIVGRSLGEPHWTVIEPGDVSQPVVAADSLMVIRPRGVDPYLLLAFLRSDIARTQMEGLASTGGTLPRLMRRHLGEVLLPALALEGLRAGDPLLAFRSTASGLVDALEARSRSAFDDPTPESIRARLTEANDDATMAADLIRQVSDPIHRARQFLPHPLARTLRVYQSHRSSGSYSEVYQDLLRFGEAAVVLLGAVGMSYISSRDDGHLPLDWTSRFQQGGVPLGTWLSAANAGAEAARRDSVQLGGLSRALSTSSQLNRDLNRFVELRNDDAHGAGPRSPYEFQQKVGELEELLEDTLLELAPLARSDWFVVASLNWDPVRRRFPAAGRSLRGDHPDFDSWSADLAEPLELGVVHVRLGDLILPLGALCSLRACSRCLHEEMYYPDKLKGSVVRLRSLDRGHESQMTIEESRLPLDVARH